MGDVREAKRITAEHVLSYRVDVVGSRALESTFSSRQAAQEEADRLRRSGKRTVVRPVTTPLPTNPWLFLQE